MLPPNSNGLSSESNQKGQVGKRVSSEEFILNYLGQSPILGAKFIISKKVVPHATSRNRIKRLLRVALKQEKGAGGQIVVIVKKDIADLKAYEVSAKLKKLLQKLK